MLIASIAFKCFKPYTIIQQTYICNAFQGNPIIGRHDDHIPIVTISLKQPNTTIVLHLSLDWPLCIFFFLFRSSYKIAWWIIHISITTLSLKAYDVLFLMKIKESLVYLSWPLFKISSSCERLKPKIMLENIVLPWKHHTTSTHLKVYFTKRGN